MEERLQVYWTGEWPCLCCGEWVIKCDGKELEVPEEVKDKDMNTYGSYGFYYFDEEEDSIEYIESGLQIDEWLAANKKWILEMFNKANIKVTDNLLFELYEKINAQDFREGTCGGCL